MARLFLDVLKGQPDTHTVHIPNAGGKKRRARSFNDARQKPVPAPAENNETVGKTLIWRADGTSIEIGKGTPDAELDAAIGMEKAGSRSLLRHDHKTAKVPFPYDSGALAGLRPDQMPRFMALITDQDKLPTKEVDLSSLTAIQNRVDPEKVKVFMDPRRGPGRLPVVARNGAKTFIIDGHHRLTADWLSGKQRAMVRYGDITPLSNQMKADWSLRFEKAVAGKPFSITKMDAPKQRVFGWGNVSMRVDGEQILDHHEDLIDMQDLEEAAYQFCLSFRQTGEMHRGEAKGDMIESFMVTPEKLEAMGLAKSALPIGWWLGFHIPDPDVFAKCLDGTYQMFSIQGKAIRVPV